MSKFWSLLMIVSLLTITPGCGSSEPVSAPQAKTTSTQKELIKIVATEFLEALRQGESETASSKLTPLAQEQIHKSDMDFSLLENEAASYTIGKVETQADNEDIEANQAIVEAVWSEPNDTAPAYQEKWTIALQNIDGQWGILGILADEGPNQPPLVMNFENPDDVFSPASTANATQPQSTIPQQAVRPNTPTTLRR